MCQVGTGPKKEASTPALGPGPWIGNRLSLNGRAKSRLQGRVLDCFRAVQEGIAFSGSLGGPEGFHGETERGSLSGDGSMHEQSGSQGLAQLLASLVGGCDGGGAGKRIKLKARGGGLNLRLTGEPRCRLLVTDITTSEKSSEPRAKPEGAAGHSCGVGGEELVLEGSSHGKFVGGCVL